MSCFGIPPAYFCTVIKVRHDIVILLPPYFENSRKRLTKTPKLYFTDTGLACHLLGIESAQQLARDKMRGALYENFIVMETLKRRRYRYNSLYRGRDKGSHCKQKLKS